MYLNLTANKITTGTIDNWTLTWYVFKFDEKTIIEKEKSNWTLTWYVFKSF